MTKPMLQGASPGVQPCPRCNDEGEVAARRLSLVTGRGANLYRHGRFASSVQIIRPAMLPMRPCPRCTGYPLLFGLTPDDLLLASARAADRQRRAVAR